MRASMVVASIFNWLGQSTQKIKQLTYKKLLRCFVGPVAFLMPQRLNTEMLRVKVASRPKLARCLSSTASEAVRTVPYLEYARSARQDVAEVMRQLEGSHSERLHGLSSMALEIWPKEAPQWRLAGEVVPQEIEAKALQQEMWELSKEETSGEARAAMLRVLCGIRSRPSMRLAASVAKDGLVWKINLQELCKCIAALAHSGWHPMPKDSILMIFAKEGLQRLAAGAKLLDGELRVSRHGWESPADERSLPQQSSAESLEQLLTVHGAALALNLQSSASGLTSELRKRVVRNEKFLGCKDGLQGARYRSIG
eukprot:s3873_g2.t1